MALRRSAVLATAQNRIEKEIKKMANENLKGVRVAILVEDGFEQVELTEPRKALEQAGAETQIVSPKSQTVRGWNFTDWDDEFPVEVSLDRTEPKDFDALHLPGGVMNPDALRMQPKAVEFVKAFFDAGKPVAVGCPGPRARLETGAAGGRRRAARAVAHIELRRRRAH